MSGRVVRYGDHYEQTRAPEPTSCALCDKLVRRAALCWQHRRARFIVCGRCIERAAREARTSSITCATCRQLPAELGERYCRACGTARRGAPAEPHSDQLTIW